ncbi:MAG: phosphatidate cytidylyltransferase, partial [Treponema sp.]|nr:phosphatidate cytidylyltransferase [Treponema sp.]
MAINSKKRANVVVKELFRKLIHLGSAFIPLFLKWNKGITIALLLFALVTYIICEAIRMRGISVPLISAITEAAARKRDENHFVLGPVTLCAGIILCALIWTPLEAASIGIYALSFGDGLASLVGKLFGRIKIPFTFGKTVEGCLACFFAIFCEAFLVSNNTFIALVLAFVGMIIEVLPLKDFDNIFIPLIIGG